MNFLFNLRRKNIQAFAEQESDPQCYISSPAKTFHIEEKYVLVSYLVNVLTKSVAPVLRSALRTQQAVGHLEGGLLGVILRASPHRSIRPYCADERLGTVQRCLNVVIELQVDQVVGVALSQAPDAMLTLSIVTTLVHKIPILYKRSVITDDILTKFD